MRFEGKAQVFGTVKHRRLPFSLNLQHGCNIETVQRALTRELDGSPAPSQTSLPSVITMVEDVVTPDLLEGIPESLQADVHKPERAAGRS